MRTYPSHSRRTGASRRRLLAAGAAAVALLLVLPGGALAATVTASQRSGSFVVDVDSPECHAANATCHWTFDPGGQTADAASAAFTAPGPGDYTAGVTVTDTVSGTSSTGSKGVHVFGPVAASFTPSAPVSGPAPLTVAFQSTSTGEITGLTWQFGDGSSSTNPTFTKIYGPGAYVARLTVSNPAWSSAAAQPITVGASNQPPTATFTSDASTTGVGGTVNFDASGSTDPEGGPLTYAWDLDGNGTYGDVPPGSAALASRTFMTAGTYKIGLKVTDNKGASDKFSDFVTVLPDKAPVPSFSFSPAAPNVSQTVTFSGSATDADLPAGAQLKLAWDLDDDGQFDDGAGPTATWSYLTPGSRIVALQATDDKGVTGVTFLTINVTGPTTGSSAAQSPPSSTPVSSPQGSASSSRRTPQLLSPFPIVRIRGLLFARSVRISLLSVKAPRGATIKVVCHGRSCSRKGLSKLVRTATKSMRFRSYERTMRPGTVIEVFVTAKNKVGKYTKFTLRRGAAPIRRDMCLRPGSSKPVKCPSQ